MSGLSIKDIFFQECEDLTDALVDGLADMQSGDSDDETVNAVFRAVHSIKGSGGAFGLTDLVNFAHKFENVLDLLRSKSIPAEPGTLATLQRAGDVLTDLVDDARNEVEPNHKIVESAAAELQVFLPDTEEEMEAEFVFDAVGIAFDDDDAEPDPIEGFQIRFEPSRGLYDCGNDPLFLLNALAELGDLSVAADIGGIPQDATELDWEESFIAWDIRLVTGATEAAVFEIFDFVQDLCALTVAPIKNDDTIEQPEIALPLDDAPDVQVAAPSAPPESSSVEVEAPKPAEVADSKQSKPSKEARATLRVDLERIDRLINAVGELIINQAVIAQRIDDAGLDVSADLSVDLEDYKLLAREIQEGVMAIRAQPVKTLFQRMARIVRELTVTTGKDVQLVTVGEDTEVDKTVVERLADPLTHMIRNAIDHGIEPAEKRLAVGKPEKGRVQLSAEHRSGSVLIEIKDDGAGLNRERIREIAVSKGIIDGKDELSIAEIDNLLFAPGFSTAQEVTNLSGRGVGMDVVKTAISSLGGRISIQSEPGIGSTFSIAMPLTLAVMDGMVIKVRDQTMVVPISGILETVRPSAQEITRIGMGDPLLSIRGEHIPIIDLATTLGHPECETNLEDMVLLLVRTERFAQCALAVDAISDQRQVVIKSLEGNYGSIPGISAATILGDGEIALIIDPDGVSSSAVNKLPSFSDHNAQMENSSV